MSTKSAKEWVWIVGVILVLAAAIGVVYVVDVCKEERGRKVVVETKAAAKEGARVRLSTAIKEATTSTPMPPLAPLWWDKGEGAYMIQLQIGDGSVELVLDTGSSQVSVKGEGCTWTQCDGNGCKTQACPCGGGNCTERYYRPAGVRIAPGEHGAGTNTTLVYGSQEDTVSHYLDKVVIPRETLTCSQLMQTVPTARWAASRRSMQQHESDNVVVHRVHHIKGVSSSNLFGLARPGKSKEQGTVLLQTLYGAANDIVWSLILRREGGWWAMGALPCFTEVHYMPLLDPPAFHAYLTKFYTVAVNAMEVGPSLDTLVKVGKHGAPQYCVVDTGTTYSYASASLGAALDKLGYDERAWYVRLHLGNPQNPVVITYTPQQMQDPDVKGSSVLQCTEGRTLDNFEDIFPGVQVLLFGAYMMRNCYWEFDVGKKLLGVQAL